MDHGSAAGRVVVLLDFRNAFGTLSRGVMAAVVAETFLELTALTEKLYRGNTELLWEDAEGAYHDVVARTGVDAGCPWSVIAFCLSVRRVLQQAAGALEQRGLSGVRFRAFMDDVYAVCHESQVSDVLEAFRRAAAACGMAVNDAKLQLWGVGPEGLPDALKPHVVQRMQILGNVTDRYDGFLSAPAFGGDTEAFRAALDRVMAAHEKLWGLAQHGLPVHIDQALARTVAHSAAQHVLRSSRVPADLAEAYDRAVEEIWCRIVGENLDAGRREQLQQPVAAGGFSAGGVTHRADAAFILGAMSAMPEMKAAAGVTTVEALRPIIPRVLADLDIATEALRDKGAPAAATAWRRDQSLQTKGRQKEWSGTVQAVRRQALFRAAPRRQVIAMQSAADVAGSAWLATPEDELVRLADHSFIIAARRRLGLAVAAGPSHTCQNRKKDGTKCGTALDAEGHHGATCL